ncbi:MAG: hypothetical protein ACK58L_20850 [Planctomycetota bacterium]
MSAPSEPLFRMSLPPAVEGLLRRVRFRLRRDAVLAGVLFSTCLAAGVFWVTTTLDLGWFELQRLELPVGLRVLLLAIMVPVGLWVIGRQIFIPLIRRVRDSDVALLLERRFPQFQDRLVTAVESSKGVSLEGPLSRPMLERSVDEAARIADQVSADEVFDPTTLQRLSLVAGGFAASILLLGLIQPQLIHRWWSAFIRCDEVYHPRTTDLQVVAIAQPGDRRVEFQWTEERQLYKHARGADLELELSVPEGGPAEGSEWVVPDRVRIDVIRADGSRSRTYVTPTADSGRVFRFVVTRLQEPVEVELLAGDFRSRNPYRIDIVNPPGLDTMTLDCQYPDYTGWNSLRERKLKVTGSEISLPTGTLFDLKAAASKPLRAVRIVTDQFELSGDRESSRLMLRDGRVIESQGRPLITADGATVIASFLVELFEPATSGSGQSSDGHVQSSGAALSGATNESEVLVDGRLRIPSNTNLRFFLHDEDDVMSVSPDSLRVQGIEDQPPVVVAQMTGVDNAITRLAKIPITGRVKDDYGLRTAGFSFQVDDETNWRPRPFRAVVPSGSLEFELGRSDTEAFELFDVQVLELSEGQRLSLSVVATDANENPGPGITRGQPMQFRIVSIEELLSLLYTREIALRGRFEEVIKQLEEVQNDLVFHQDVAKRLDAAGVNGSSEDRVSLNTCASRSGNNLRRQANEMSAVVVGFEEIVRQLINNSVPPAQLAENMTQSIVEPLRQVAGEQMVEADRAVSLFRVAVQEGQSSVTLVTASREEVSETIQQLREILENVRDMAEFHEALRDLKAILDEQQKTLDETKKLQKSQLIDVLK